VGLTVRYFLEEYVYKSRYSQGHIFALETCSAFSLASAPGLILKMFLKFSKADILNSPLVYPETGALGYTILTRPHFIRDADKDSDTVTDCEDDNGETRRTLIFNKLGETIAEIGWKGRQPIEIVIGQEKITGAKGMFGCSSAILSCVPFTHTLIHF
jgi:hypothetical protein